ncbi:Serine protease, DegP/HtrA, do-like protein [Lachnospiraceae bacterium TWA4]|nr:Serine protease, DegP/HtrA, do-like protein [Lachnospiraceae bacterium TWA4]
MSEEFNNEDYNNNREYEYTGYSDYKEVEPEPTINLEPKSPKKKNGFVKKAASLVLAAVVFGGVAGGTMVGVNYASQKSGLVASSKTIAASNKIEQAQTVTPATSTTSNGTSVLDVSKVVENTMPTVVAITNSQIYQRYSNSPFDYYEYFFGNGSGSSRRNNNDGQSQYQEVGAGSGIIIDKSDTELLIATNNHVIEDADELTITFADEKTAKAVVKGTDSNTDLAVVSVKIADLEDSTLSAIKVATIGNSDNLKVGEGVIAIGNAMGYGQSVTVGYVSALNRTIQTEDNVKRTVLQTDAAINPGNSGGALLNTKGELIGINSAKYSDTSVEGIGYAIPISQASSIIDNLKIKEAKVEVEDEGQQGYLGINAASVDSSSASMYGMPTGVYVYSIAEGGAASKSELKKGDIITKLEGETLNNREDLVNELKYYKGGTKVELTIQRLENGSYVEHTITVTLGYAKDKISSSNQATSPTK